MRLGWVAGRILARDGNGPVLIGKDTRISGYMFESALESGLSAAGVDIRLLGPMPTPGIAYLTKSTRAQAGIVISASHNPYYDNGIKFFSGDGTKLSDEIELQIESELDMQIKPVPSGELGRARRIPDAPRRYIEFCKSKVNSNLDLSDLKVVLDCANGAAYQIAPKVFEELGADVICYAISPDGLNINHECGAAFPDALCELVRKHQADVGIALDGDGDRVLMVDHEGKQIDGDDIIYIIAQFNANRLNGAIVGTVMSNLGLERAINELELNFLRAAVGDRYVVEMLRKENLILGGETSGHIINLDMSTTGDGIIAALQILKVMCTTGKPLADLIKNVTKFPQVIKNVKSKEKIDAYEIENVKDAVKDAENTLGKNGRVVLRPSGTEPLIRIMIEGENSAQVETLADELSTTVAREVNRPD